MSTQYIYIYIRKYISHIISSQSCRFVRFLGVLNCFTEVCRPSRSIRIRDIGAEAIQDIYGDTNIQECKVVQNDSELSDYHIFFARCSASSSVCSKCSTWCSKRILKEMRNIQLKFNWVFQYFEYIVFFSIFDVNQTVAYSPSIQVSTYLLLSKDDLWQRAMPSETDVRKPWIL